MCERRAGFNFSVLLVVLLLRSALLLISRKA